MLSLGVRLHCRCLRVIVSRCGMWCARMPQRLSMDVSAVSTGVGVHAQPALRLCLLQYTQGIVCGWSSSHPDALTPTKNNGCRTLRGLHRRPLPFSVEPCPCVLAACYELQLRPQNHSTRWSMPAYVTFQSRIRCISQNDVLARYGLLTGWRAEMRENSVQDCVVQLQRSPPHTATRISRVAAPGRSTAFSHGLAEQAFCSAR